MLESKLHPSREYSNQKEFGTQKGFNENDFIRDFEYNDKKFFGNFALIAILLLIIAGGLGVTWYYYKPKINSVKKLLPIVKADTTPFKIKPLEPGGMVVANMDKTIYDHLSGSNQQNAKTERLLPEPEEPLDRVNIISNGHHGTNINGTNNNHIKTVAVNIAKELNSQTKLVKHEHKENLKQIVANKIPLIATEKIIEANDNNNDLLLSEAEILDPPQTTSPVKLPLSEKKPAKEVVNSPETESKIKLNVEVVKRNKEHINGYRVQLASFKSQKEVNTEWNKIKKLHNLLLKKYDYIIARKEISGKGTYFRLQIGPVSREADARHLCKKLVASGQNCFVLKPGQN